MNMPNTPCHILVIPTRNGEHGQGRYVRGSKGPEVYEDFAAARANIDDAAQQMDTLSRCGYLVTIVATDGSTRRWMSDDLVDDIWEKAEDDRYHNCIGARLRRGEAVAV
jgi:hypothetical protein